jgi:methylmalonyl-CoA/ethylmalonyl-CoA epimerase
LERLRGSGESDEGADPYKLDRALVQTACTLERNSRIAQGRNGSRIETAKRVGHRNRRGLVIATHHRATLSGRSRQVNIVKVDHLGIAVQSIEQAVRLFVDTLGGTFVAGGDDDRRQIRLVQIRLPGFKIELMQPLGPDSYLQRYLDRHGQGFHHLTLFVDDIVKAVEYLAVQGFETVDLDTTSVSWKEAYVRPKSGFGTLIQLAETDQSWDDSIPGITLEAVLAGRVAALSDRYELRGELG